MRFLLQLLVDSSWFVVRGMWRAVRLGLMGVGLVALLLVYVDPSAQRELKQRVRRVMELFDTVMPHQPVADAPPILWPVDEGTRVTSRFGTRVHPLTGARQRVRGR